MQSVTKRGNIFTFIQIKFFLNSRTENLLVPKYAYAYIHTVWATNLVFPAKGLLFKSINFS